MNHPLELVIHAPEPSVWRVTYGALSWSFPTREEATQFIAGWSAHTRYQETIDESRRQ